MRTTRSVLPTLALAMLFSTAHPAEASVSSVERDALLQIYNATNGPSWTDKTGWAGPTGTECSWYGIACDETETTVVQLYLGYNNLAGTLPSALSQLQNLTVISLEGNRLTGPVPSAILQLQKLTTLSFYDNQLSGEIPAELSRLTMLDFVSLGSNALTGTIPSSLGSLAKLEVLDLSYNRLTGAIPSSLGDLRALRSLYLAENDLTGTIPIELLRITTLEELYLGNNALTGTIPPSLGSLPNLAQLDLSGNQLSGAIPVELTQLARLTVLYLGYNQLTGSVPPELGNLSNLQFIDLSSNRLTGELPTELRQLSQLVGLYIGENELTGEIPPDIGSLTLLEYLSFAGNDLTGSIPAALGNLSKLRSLQLYGNSLSGPIPPELFQIRTLQELYLDANRLTGTLPAGLSDLTELVTFSATSNLLEGAIPDLSRLTKLDSFDLYDNRLTGPIPAGLGNATQIHSIGLGYNNLTGTIPPAILALTSLESFAISGNHITGAIPDLSTLTHLRGLYLGANLFTGAIPSSIGNITSLQYLELAYNALTGAVPSAITKLTNLQAGGLDISYNALSSNDATVRAFLAAKQTYDWEETQNLPLASVTVAATKARSVVLNWPRIKYAFDEGGYQIVVTRGADPAPVKVITTADKALTSVEIDELEPSTQYSFVIRTVTYEHDYQQSQLTSDPTAPVSATTTADVPSPPLIVITNYPYGLIQTAGTAGALDYYGIKNVGDQPTTITITQTGDFFTQTPTSFDIAEGEEWYVELTALARPAGAYSGASQIGGTGTPAGGLTVPIRLLSVIDPEGTPIAESDTNRIDVTAPIGNDPSGTVKFTNVGSGTLSGIVVADVGWIVPPTGLITLAPSQSVDVTFQIDRDSRPDAASLQGAATGTLSLVYASSGAAKQLWANGKRGPLSGPGVSASLVTVVDTVKPPVTSSGIPALGPTEVALFVPGVGHVQGGVGLFLSDITISNTFGVDLLSDLKAHFLPSADAAGASSTASLAAVSPGQGLQLADVVKSVFGGEQLTGTMQLRTKDWQKLFVNANIFNVSNPSGTYGTTIPIFRSDRSLAPGQSLYLTGLKKSATTRTNIFVQETNGAAATFRIDFLDVYGAVLGGSNESIEAFRMIRLLDRVPAGALTARLTNASTSTGRLVAYATPVDQASGDFWSVVDWNLQEATKKPEAVIVPVAGSIRGANDTFFRTDLSIHNGTGKLADGTLYYYDRGGSVNGSYLALAPGETRSFDDIAGTYFNAGSAALGYLVFVPDHGIMTVGSRTFATVASQPGTYGTGVPAIPVSAALRLGQSKRINGLEVSSLATIGARKGGTFRTNIGLIETSGAPVTVRVTVYYSDSRSLAFGPLTSFDVGLRAGEVQLLSDLSNRLSTLTRGEDLKNVALDFRVISGDGALIAYASSVDNGSGDSLLRTE